jgi:hypothetical protein
LALDHRDPAPPSEQKSDGRTKEGAHGRSKSNKQQRLWRDRLQRYRCTRHENGVRDLNRSPLSKTPDLLRKLLIDRSPNLSLSEQLTIADARGQLAVELGAQTRGVGLGLGFGRLSGLCLRSHGSLNIADFPTDRAPHRRALLLYLVQ